MPGCEWAHFPRIAKYKRTQGQPYLNTFIDAYPRQLQGIFGLKLVDQNLDTMNDSFNPKEVIPINICPQQKFHLG